MKDWYFYQDKGRTQGPLTLQELKKRVRDGSLRLFDLIYKEGEPGWRMALEHPDIRGEFKQAGANTSERPWVCLHRKSEDTFEFVTLGPFSEEEVRQAIAAGHLSYGDYAWKQDFAEWMRLGSLEAFNPRAATLNRVAQKNPDPEEETPEQLLRDVVEMKRRKTERVERAPSDAKGPDLTKSEEDIATRIVTKQELVLMSAPPPPPEAAKTKTEAKHKVFEGMTFKPPKAAVEEPKFDPEATRVVTASERKPRLDDDATRVVTRREEAPANVPRISTRGPVADEDFEPTAVERRPLMETGRPPKSPWVPRATGARCRKSFRPIGRSCSGSCWL